MKSEWICARAHLNSIQEIHLHEVSANITNDCYKYELSQFQYKQSKPGKLKMNKFECWISLIKFKCLSCPGHVSFLKDKQRKKNNGSVQIR